MSHTSFARCECRTSHLITIAIEESFVFFKSKLISEVSVYRIGKCVLKEYMLHRIEGAGKLWGKSHEIVPKHIERYLSITYYYIGTRGLKKQS